MSAETIYQFGAFEVDPARRQLRRDGMTIALRPTVFDVLVYLVENPGRLVTKQELFEAVWPGRIVEEANISQAIFKLRKALGDERIVVTAPGQGYRFTATVASNRNAPLATPDTASVLAVATAMGAGPTLALPLMQQIVSSTALVGRRYEGFYRSTRPYSLGPGRFIHDHLLVRMGDDGLLRLKLSTGGVMAEGWVLPVQNMLFIICTEYAGGHLVFAILYGVNSVVVDKLDGLILNTTFDIGRMPIAMPVVFQRIESLTGDIELDDARLSMLAAGNPLAPDGSVPEALRRHLARDSGPTASENGGDWVLQLPPLESLSAGERLV